MKTAISIPDPIFEEAEETAQSLGMSRSEFYATAIAEYLENLRDQSITDRLNAVFDEVDSSLDPVIAKMQAISLPKEEW